VGAPSSSAALLQAVITQLCASGDRRAPTVKVMNAWLNGGGAQATGIVPVRRSFAQRHDRFADHFSGMSIKPTTIQAPPPRTAGGIGPHTGLGASGGLGMLLGSPRGTRPPPRMNTADYHHPSEDHFATRSGVVPCNQTTEIIDTGRHIPLPMSRVTGYSTYAPKHATTHSDDHFVRPGGVALVGLRRPSRDFSRCAYGGYGGAWSHRPLPVERFHEAAPVQRVMTAPRKLWPQEYDKVK